MKRKKNFKIYSVLPLRDIVVFPGMVIPLFVGREKSIKAIEHAISNNDKIFLVSQTDASKENVEAEDLFSIGVVAKIVQMIKLPDGNTKVMVEGERRARIVEFTGKKDFISAITADIEYTKYDENDAKISGYLRTLITKFEEYVKINKKIGPEVLIGIVENKNPEHVADLIISNIPGKLSEKQQILEESSFLAKLEKTLELVTGELEIIKTESQIAMQVKEQMEKSQREYYLNEQLKVISKQLGDTDAKDDLKTLEDKVNSTKFSKEAKEKALSELKKLKQSNPMAAESSIIRNYLELMVALPWSVFSKHKIDLSKAQDILNEEHYGLEKVKERILEYLAVQARVKKMKGSILCFVGPPGVGKTSLAKSIAKATGRSFAKISLGGVHDESEIRGHRRTYIGALPGKIIQSMKKAKVSNPLILLDEIDKMASDYRGDPASALLEVLDAEQNHAFVDNYLEVEYDLSNVLFVCTANSTNMPRPLLDRMEVIKLSGYVEDEKKNIAQSHLVNKIMEDNGLKSGELSITEEAILDIIRYYTYEAGVRNLERELSKLGRKVVKQILIENTPSIEIGRENLSKYLGVHKFTIGEAEEKDLVGIVNGLAYTDAGGDLLSIEAVLLPGKGDIKATGKLGDVMQESAIAAYSFFRSKSAEYGVVPPYYQKKDIHIHVPEGATPKDGPSAGITMFTSIVSAMTGIAVRHDVAMTGEITLRGRVLPIGGLKEKLMAALRGKIKTVIIPKDNAKDLADIPENIKQSLEIITVESAEEVLNIALISKVSPVSWVEIDTPDKIMSEKKHNDVITH